jgi:hypothetical protein
MSLHKRLERLEAIEGGRPDEQERERAGRRRRAMQRFLHEIARARRRNAGLEAGPELPYTEGDRADDEWILREVIPRYRNSPGYQSGQGREFVDAWEQHIRDNLEKGAS